MNLGLVLKLKSKVVKKWKVYVIIEIGSIWLKWCYRGWIVFGGWWVKDGGWVGGRDCDEYRYDIGYWFLSCLIFGCDFMRDWKDFFCIRM